MNQDWSIFFRGRLFVFFSMSANLLFSSVTFLIYTDKNYGVLIICCRWFSGRWVMTILLLFPTWIQHFGSKFRNAIGRLSMLLLLLITSMFCGDRWAELVSLWISVWTKEGCTALTFCLVYSYYRSTGISGSLSLWCLLKTCFATRNANQIYLNLMTWKVTQVLTNKEPDLSAS